MIAMMPKLFTYALLLITSTTAVFAQNSSIIKPETQNISEVLNIPFQLQTRKFTLTIDNANCLQKELRQFNNFYLNESWLEFSCELMISSPDRVVLRVPSRPGIDEKEITVGDYKVKLEPKDDRVVVKVKTFKNDTKLDFEIAKNVMADAAKLGISASSKVFVMKQVEHNAPTAELMASYFIEEKVAAKDHRDGAPKESDLESLRTIENASAK